jgi:hypothetical protein
MSRIRTFLRVIILTIVALAITSVPVVRAFVEMVPLRCASMAASAGSRGSSKHLMCRLPRMRRPKQSLFDVLPVSGPSLPVLTVTSRLVPAWEQSVRTASFAVLPDHPPA